MFTVVQNEKEYTYNDIREFSKAHKIRIGKAADLLSGKIREVGGFTLYKGKAEVYELPSTFELENLKGEVFVVTDVPSFLAEHKLKKKGLEALVKGDSIFHSGFILKGNQAARELVLSMG